MKKEETKKNKDLELKVRLMEIAIKAMEMSRDINSSGSVSIPHLDRASMYMSSAESFADEKLEEMNKGKDK